MLTVINLGGQIDLVSFWPPNKIGDNMKYPCKKCLVTACCTEVCNDLSEFYTIVYEDYKEDPLKIILKHDLSKKVICTLEELYKAAGHRPVTFTSSGKTIKVAIDFSINDPPKHNFSCGTVKTIQL